MTRATTPKFAAKLGRAIAAARSVAGLSQGEVARALGITPATVSRWESGVQTPSVEALVQIAKLLDVTPNDLIG